MELIMEQFPIVIHSLNVGFLQTLKLFFATLLGAIPLGLVIAFGSMSHFKPLSYITNIIVWIVRGTPLMIQMLIIYYFPGLVLISVICRSLLGLSSLTSRHLVNIFPCNQGSQ